MADAPATPSAPRKAVWPPPRPGGPVARPPGRPAPPPPIRERGRMGYLDKETFTAWEMNLTGSELDDWKRVRAILEKATPEFRASVTYVLFEQELQNGRNYYAQAIADSEVFRADCIKGQAGAFKGQIARLDAAVHRFLTLSEQWVELGRQVLTAQQEAETIVKVIAMARTSFRKVSAPWNDCWPGAARGRGISKYDTPAGVAAVKAEVDASCARRRGEEMRRRAAREPEPEEERQRAPLPRRDATPSLFGGGGGDDR